MTAALRLTLPGAVKNVKVTAVSAPAGVAAVTHSPAAGAKASATVTAELQAQKQKLQLACQALETAARQLQETRQELLAQAQEQMLDLTLSLAQKALMQEITGGRVQIEPLLKEALQRMSGRQDVTVYLNPEDLGQLTGQASETQDGPLRLMPDNVVQRGQCLVETMQGASIWSYQDRLDDLADALKSPE